MSDSDFRQLYIPPGFAHGFCVTSPVAQVEYKCTDVYDPEGERGLPWDDEDLAIDWPLTGAPMLSGRDSRHPTLREQFPGVRRR